jgi:hypothetical protein
MRHAALELEIKDKKIQNALKVAVEYGMKCFGDLFVQIQEMDSEPSLDTYAWETMSESLVCHFAYPLRRSLSGPVHRNLHPSAR